jgi:RHS repeat-associated protein
VLPSRQPHGPTCSDNVTYTKFRTDPSFALPQLALEQDGAGALVRRYLSGLDTISVAASASDVFFYHRDPLGSVRDITDANGNQVAGYDYEPYGVIRTQTGTLDQPLGFTGQYQDPTGLYHLRARQYDPTTGRFLGVDPAEQTLNGLAISPYGYAGSQPTTSVDPSGLTLVPSQQADNAADGASSAWTLGIGDWLSTARHAYVSADAWLNSNVWDPLAEDLDVLLGVEEFKRCAGEYIRGDLNAFGTCGVLAVSFVGPGKALKFRAILERGLAAKSLPAPRQIEAAWGAGVYRHGGLMSSIEHVNYRHAFGSGFEDVSRFSRGTSVRQIKQYVEDALRHGVVNGGTINYNVGRVIGTDAAGNPVTGIRVHVRNDIIRTAFPVAP